MLQQNNVAKRMNKTIYKIINCMFSHVKFPNSFWGEAIRTETDLVNHFHLVTLGGGISKRV